MQFELWWILVIWILIGALCAVLVYRDMRGRKRIDMKVVLLCLPLSVIGLLFYFSTRDMSKERGRELPPKPDYGKPEYRFKEEKPKPVKTAEKVEVPEIVTKEESMPEVKVEEEPAVMPTPPVEEKKEVPEEKPRKKVTQIEGIPRCPECGAAISTYDIRCLGCGAQLK
ncbi:MAG TPA: hypothetical protein VLH13_04205 [Methanomassiliicoccales archaeon]|nr:hypothetical protein [Methanomassiliicoccales archaeon]